VILVALTILAYSNTFQVPMLFDDEGSIIRNPVVHDLYGFLSNGKGYDYNPFRFVGYLTFALNYQLGGLNVAGYHLVNLAIHVANALLVYSLIRQIFRTPALCRSALASRSNQFAFTVALLFACHPIQTQAVTYIVQRLTSLATLFFLASLALHARWRLAATAGARFLSAAVLPCYLLSLATAILAMKTKEIAFTLPMVILLYEFCFFGRPGRRLLSTITPLLLTTAIIPFTMLNLHKPVGELLSDMNTDTVAGSLLSRGEYLCTQFSVIVTYIRLLVLPINQNLDYDFPISHSLLEPKAFLSLLLLLVIIAGALTMWRKGAGNDDSKAEFTNAAESGRGEPLYELRLAAFGIFWFFITLAVESSLIPIADVIFEHRVYLPSVGFFAALAALVAVGSRMLATRFRLAAGFVMPVTTVIVLLLAGATHARNHVWRDWITIWQDTVKKSPNKARPHNILGIGYLNQRFFDDAFPEFDLAVKLNPDYMQAYFNLGLAFKVLERADDAAAMFQRALSLAGVKDNEMIAHISNELAVAYVLQGKLDRAVETFSSAVRNQPDNPEYRKNHGHALLQMGRPGAAAEEFRSALRLRPGDTEAREILLGIEHSGAGAPVNSR
jgi:protein O-mannosyl-transferase